MLFQDAWDVFLLFTVPVGGGIPAGVLLADARGLGWGVMLGLYFASDIVLACVFEPVMLGMLRWARSSPRASKALEVMGRGSRKAVERWGVHPSPFALVMITFGTDPMTGRAVAKAAGHGFLTGWAVTIAGDMLFFTVVMVSTLRLSDWTGNGTLAAVIVTLAILLAPALVRKARAALTRRGGPDRFPG
ncbi:MAG: hypothetical protein HUU37_02775 [Bdellovibrionales bacterium]|nr:hypothetical protein [Bdellovibrionales bacterium]